EHQNISTLINNTNIDIIITYGILSEITQKHISKDKYSKHYNNKNKLKIEINNLICKNDIIYLKGSRGMGLEYIYKEN
ncbi:UDP-N-acetylmuramoyl-tripeptide--D-alanyl-D-alanine ligase, partial [Candidatus Marinimicrobia bacterium]|nr:UDP-N-acetylmuramoyl-tripeptide--D-alanyl-D-alanine ligase [Candidatus Neomarinimicrobiota bacterium]